jgi:hypothetical protein
MADGTSDDRACREPAKRPGYNRASVLRRSRGRHCRQGRPKRQGSDSVHSRCGLHTRAVTVFRDPLSEGFRHFVASMPAPVASGWSGHRVGLAPTGKRRLFTAHTQSGNSAHRDKASYYRVSAGFDGPMDGINQNERQTHRVVSRTSGCPRPFRVSAASCSRSSPLKT